MAGTKKPQRAPECPRCGKVMGKNGFERDGKQKWRCFKGSNSGDGARGEICYSGVNVAADDPKKAPADFKLQLSGNLFVITGAQNGTPVVGEFLETLKVVAGARKAQLVVVPMRYRNPTSTWTASQAGDEVWAEEVIPYLCNQRRVLSKHLVLLGDAKVQPTATDPTAGFDGVTGEKSAILAHTKVALRSVPQLASHGGPKIMVTTGSVTRANYTDSRAGALGEFHHSLAAVIVEITGSGGFHIRHLHWDPKRKSVVDLDVEYFASGKVTKAPRALALICGDLHVGSVDPGVEKATFGKGGMMERLRPLNLVLHDTFDGISVNPHMVNPFEKLRRQNSKLSNVREEVQRCISYVREVTPEDCTAVAVASNHDSFLSRWVATNDWRTDPENAEYYLELAHKMVKRGTGNAVAIAFEGSGIHILSPDESFRLAGIELGMHGHLGPNGAKGSLKNLSKIAQKSVTGHSHTAGIIGGAIAVGTSTTLRLGYNVGPSSWGQAHCLLLANGKRQLVFIVDGKWRI